MDLKKEYMKPDMEIVVIDNEINLILQSEPPLGPEESINIISGITSSIFKM